MTALVIGIGSAGDVHANVALSIELQRRGHRVVFAASPVFESVAKRAGLEMIPLGTREEYEEALRDPYLWDPFRSFSVVARRLIIPSIRPIYRIIEDLSRSGDLTVTAPFTAFGARIAREKLGVRLVTIHLQPVTIRSEHNPPVFGFPHIIGRLPRPLRRLYLWAVDRNVVDPLLAPAVNSFRGELGLPPVHRFFNGWVHSPDLVLGLFPDWFAPPQPDWPPNIHLTGFPLYDEAGTRPPAEGLAAFLKDPDPPVVFTAGSAHAASARFFCESLEACRAGGYRGILLTQFPALLPEQLPDSVRHFEYVPFSTVLPHAAAFVHHGGIGTTAQALSAGVPQLVVPFAHDQPDHAVRVRRLGVGDYLVPRRYEAASAVRSLRRLLDSGEIRDNCRRRAKELAKAKPIDHACGLIEAGKL